MKSKSVYVVFLSFIVVLVAKKFYHSSKQTEGIKLEWINTQQQYQHTSRDPSGKDREERRVSSMTTTQEGVLQQHQESYHKSLEGEGGDNYKHRETTTEEEPEEQWKTLKIGIYMTTHLSILHQSFLEKCWPEATKRIPLFQHSDLIMYTSSKHDDQNTSRSDSASSESQGDDNKVRSSNMEETSTIRTPPLHYREQLNYTQSHLEELLHFRSIQIYDAMSFNKYQLGAKMAMIEPYFETTHATTTTATTTSNDDLTAILNTVRPRTKSWFHGYDWIIRLNPDVLIKDDAWIRSQLTNPNVNVIGVDCNKDRDLAMRGDILPWDDIDKLGMGRIKLHSDFIAFRPNAINTTQLISTLHNQPWPFHNAEYHLTNALLTNINDDVIAYVPGVSPYIEKACRVRGESSPVVHDHALVNFCPGYFNVSQNQKGFHYFDERHTKKYVKYRKRMAKKRKKQDEEDTT